MIHDLGLLVERQAFPEQFKEVIRVVSETGRPFCEVENEIIGADHQALGSALATKWKFPRGLTTVLGYHHKTEKLSEDARLPAAIVYAADVLCCHEQIGFYLTADHQPLDDTFLESLGLSEADFNKVREELPAQVEEAEGIFKG